MLGALVFFVVTNFGVWASGMYGYTLSGLINCFILAIPFFGYSLVSTLIYATIIEILLRFSFLKKLLSNSNKKFNETAKKLKDEENKIISQKNALSKKTIFQSAIPSFKRIIVLFVDTKSDSVFGCLDRSPP